MKIAIVGATGLVGRKILQVLDEYNLIIDNEISLFASAKSENKIVEINNKQFIVKVLNDNNLSHFDIVLFSAGKDISLKWANKFVDLGAYVIDNSSAFRRCDDVPLVVPEVNASTITEQTKIVANPNCSTIQLVYPLWVLNKINPIKRVVVSTYQAISGAGQKGIDDFANRTTNKFPYQIYNNLIPQIDVFMSNGNTYEEDKMIFETQKILQKKISISATCVRVPIINCHSESVNIEFENKVDLSQLKHALAMCDGIKICDDINNLKYPMPIIANEKNDIFIGRIRLDENNPSTVNMFIVSDNIRKGASTNAVQIAKYIQKNLL